MPFNNEPIYFYCGYFKDINVKVAVYIIHIMSLQINLQAVGYGLSITVSVFYCCDIY